MPTLGHMLRARRRELGLSLAQVAERAGCRRSYLSMIENGRRAPSEGMLRCLETALEFPRGELVEKARWEAAPDSLKRRLEAAEARERRARELAGRLLSGSTNLDAMWKSGALRQLVEPRASNVEQPQPVARVPLINRVAAGHPRHFTDLDYPAGVADEYILCPATGDPDAFATRVVGDSMEPEYREGDVVVFSPAQPTPDGCDCFVRFEADGDTTFKRVFFEGRNGRRIRLQPLNPQYPVRVVDREEVAGMYAAISVVRPVRRS